MSTSTGPNADPVLLDTVTQSLAAAPWVAPTTIAATVGAGLTAGVFFSFSTFVMAGLRQAGPEVGLAAMQAINRAAPTPAFMTVLFGSSALAGVLAIRALADLDRPGAGLVVAGAAASALTLGVTIAFHVPRNDALALLDPGATGSVDAWRDYARVWTAGNHVRTLASTAATGLLALALRAGWTGG